MKKFWISCLLISLSLTAFSQDENQLNKGVFEFSYANDVTGLTDKYYTNGVGFSLTLPIFIHSPFNPGWLKKSKFSESYHTVNFHYDVFTPDLKSALYTDRPFAATMMLGSKHQYVYSNKSIRLTSEIKLGIVGQATGAGKIQNALHELMPGAGPVYGWDTQIRNDLGVNYIFGIEKKYNPTEFIEVIGSTTVFLGMPYTKLDPAVLIRIGLFEDYFNYLINDRKKVWQAYFLSGIKGSVVAYNATLQGGLFNTNNPYVLDDINHFVMDMSLGIGLNYRNTSLTLTQHFITPEFQGGTSHSWGDFRIVVCF